MHEGKTLHLPVPGPQGRDGKAGARGVSGAGGTSRAWRAGCVGERGPEHARRVGPQVKGGARAPVKGRWEAGAGRAEEDLT